MSELRAYELDEEQEELDGMEEQEVPILDDTDAEYMLAVKRRAEEHYKEMEAWYARKLQQEKERMQRRVAWAESNLKSYFATVPQKTTKAGWKTYELPSGKLVLKHQEPKYDTKDEELVPWLKANRPELVKTKESSDWANLKKELAISPDGTAMVTEDGEIVPGITVTQREDKFTVTLK